MQMADWINSKLSRKKTIQLNLSMYPIGRRTAQIETLSADSRIMNIYQRHMLLQRGRLPKQNVAIYSTEKHELNTSISQKLVEQLIYELNIVETKRKEMGKFNFC